MYISYIQEHYITNKAQVIAYYISIVVGTKTITRKKYEKLKRKRQNIGLNKNKSVKNEDKKIEWIWTIISYISAA